VVVYRLGQLVSEEEQHREEEEEAHNSEVCNL
jgi:hypothetical protein